MDKLKMQTANKTMTSAEKIKVFEDRKIRAQWDSDREDRLLSVVDVVETSTDSRDYQTARKYWNKLKQRTKDEDSELVLITPISVEKSWGRPDFSTRQTSLR